MSMVSQIAGMNILSQFPVRSRPRRQCSVVMIPCAPADDLDVVNAHSVPNADYRYARHMVWDQVAQSYMQTFVRASAGRKQTCPRGVPRTDCPEERYKPTDKCLRKGDRDYD